MNGADGRAFIEGVIARQNGLYLYWLPVFFGAGIVAYFSINFEPSVWLGLLGFAGALGLTVLAYPRRKDGPWRIILFGCAAALCVMMAGFGLARHRTHAVATPMLDHKINRAQVTGTIQAIEFLEEGKGLEADPRRPRY